MKLNRFGINLDEGIPLTKESLEKFYVSCFEDNAKKKSEEVATFHQLGTMAKILEMSAYHFEQADKDAGSKLFGEIHFILRDMSEENKRLNPKDRKRR